MTDAGELSYDGRHIMTPRIEAAQQKQSVTISGDIACGEPIYAEQEYGDSVSLPASLVRKGEFFMLRAQGDSMINIGVEDGDSATLKRYTLDRKNKKVVLLPENDEYEPIVCDEIHIMGVMVYLLKDMHGA